MIKLSDFYFIFSVFIILISFFLGTYVLENVGIQYASEGGSALFKIHLGSYVGFLLFFLFIVKGGIEVIKTNLGVLFKSWIFTIGAIIYLIVYGLLKQGMAGMAYTIDTLLLPVLIFSVVIGLNSDQKRIILNIITVLMLINAFTAVFEYVRSSNLWQAEYVSYFYFRANGWLAHPLNNALIMACITPILFRNRFVNPMVYFYITLLALFAFGGRTATGIYIFFSSILLILIAVEQYKINQGFKLFGVVIFASSFVAGLTLVFYMIFEMNIGSRIFENIALDGSAQTRLDIFNIFSYLTSSELLFGAKQDIFEDLFYYAEVNVVENYVIGWILNFGLVGSLPLVVGFFIFLKNIYSRSDVYGKFSVLIFVTVSITNNSLSVKTVAFLFFLIVVACNLNRRDQKW